MIAHNQDLKHELVAEYPQPRSERNGFVVCSVHFMRRPPFRLTLETACLILSLDAVYDENLGQHRRSPNDPFTTRQSQKSAPARHQHSQDNEYQWKLGGSHAPGERVHHGGGRHLTGLSLIGLGQDRDLSSLGCQCKTKGFCAAKYAASRSAHGRGTTRKDLRKTLEINQKYA